MPSIVFVVVFCLLGFVFISTGMSILLCIASIVSRHHVHVMLLNMHACVWTGQYRLIVTLPVMYWNKTLTIQQETGNQYGVWQINYQWYMELKIMEQDHPLSYFQRSASLWSSFDFRKFSIDLQKQNNYLFNQTSFSTCFCAEKSHFTSPIHSPLP